MQRNEFLNLEYKDKLHVVNQTGKLMKSLIFNEYRFSLYQVKDFYVELKRKYDQLYFDSIIAMNYEDLPLVYK